MSYVINFFKVIFIFFGILMITIIPGYFLNMSLKSFNFRKLGFIGVIIAYLFVTFSSIKGGNLISVGLFIAYILAMLSFIAQEKTLKDEYKEIKFIDSDLDLAFACIYSYVIPAIILTNQPIKHSIPFDIYRLDWYLYVCIMLFTIFPTMKVVEAKNKINIISSKITKKKTITADDLTDIFSSILSKDDNEEDKDKKINEIMDIISYFEDKGAIKKVALNDGEYFYIESDYYNTIKSEIHKFVTGKEFIKVSDAIHFIEHNYDLEKYFCRNVFEKIISGYSEWVDFNDLLLTENFIDKVITEVDKQYKKTGDYLVSEICSKFKINPNNLINIIEYRQYEYKNLGFVNNGVGVGVEEESQQNEENYEVKNQLVDRANPNVIEKIDINSCTEGELSKVPGIGIVLAKKAIKYIKENNSFSSVGEFIRFLDLKPHIVETVKNYICCNPIVNIQKNSKLVGRKIDY